MARVTFTELKKSLEATEKVLKGLLNTYDKVLTKLVKQSILSLSKGVLG